MASTLEIIRPIFDTPTLPSLGPERRAEAWELAEVEEKLTELLTTSGVTGNSADKVRSAALLWHDHLDASHEISQDIRDSDGSFLHGIMHRREPDYPNAKYWFNRTGTHAGFPEVAYRAKEILKGSPLAELADGAWDSFGMVDAVAAAQKESNEYELLREIQKVEFEVLLVTIYQY